MEDDEPTLLLTEKIIKGENMVLLNETGVVPKLKSRTNQFDSDVWYLKNGASNHMCGKRSKFKELDMWVIDQVKFGDGSTVNIEWNGTVAFVCK